MISPSRIESHDWLIDWLIENFQFYSLQMQLHNNQQYNSYLGRATKN